MQDRRIDILMISCNRPGYTRLALGRLLESCTEEMRVWVWQNGPDQETVRVVRSFEGHPRLHRLELCPENQKLIPPTNWIFAEGDAPFIGKVDDDCLVVDGWAEELRATLEADQKMGVAACWHFLEGDFDSALAAPKIRTLSSGRQIMRNRWVQGSGILLKRACVQDLGLLPPGTRGLTAYLLALADRGWMLGWPLPLVLIDHMDDPRSAHSRFKSESDFRSKRPLSAEFGDVHSLAEWKERVQWNARQVQMAPLYEGRFGMLRSLPSRLWLRLLELLGIEPAWRRAARRKS